METIERASIHNRVDSLLDIPPPTSPRPRKWAYNLWRGTVAFLTVTSVSFGVASLFALRDAAAVGWQSAYAGFRWAVLVRGDQIEIDEIGRYLKQIDGVGDVTFVSNQSIIDRLKDEPQLRNHVSVLNPAQLPAVWQVTWTPAFDLATIDDTVADLRRLPGIVDVAYEKRELDKIYYFRALWLKMRFALSILTVLGAILGSLLLGRFLFFTPLKGLPKGRLVEVTLVSAAAWMAGLGLARSVVGPFPWDLAWGTLAAAVARLAASHTRRPE